MKLISSPFHFTINTSLLKCYFITATFKIISRILNYDYEWRKKTFLLLLFALMSEKFNFKIIRSKEMKTKWNFKRNVKMLNKLRIWRKNFLNNKKKFYFTCISIFPSYCTTEKSVQIAWARSAHMKNEEWNISQQ